VAGFRLQLVNIIHARIVEVVMGSRLNLFVCVCIYVCFGTIIQNMKLGSANVVCETPQCGNDFGFKVTGIENDWAWVVFSENLSHGASCC